MATSLSTFGIKHHPQGQSWPWGSRTCLDVRHFRNPYMFKGKSKGNGRTPSVINYITADPEFDRKYTELMTRVTMAEGHVALYCVGGQDRSVYLADRLARELGLPPAVHIDLEE